MCSEIVSHDAKPIIITRQEYDDLAELVFAIDGLYELMKESSQSAIDVASVLKPIVRDAWRLHDPIHNRTSPSLLLPGDESEPARDSAVDKNELHDQLEHILSSNDDDDAKKAVVFIIETAFRTLQAEGGAE